MNSTASLYSNPGDDDEGGFQMPMKARGVGQGITGMNPFLRSLINPFMCHDAHIPDTDSTPCVLKTTTNTNTVTQPAFTTAGLVLNFPVPNEDVLRFYLWDPTSSRYYLNAVLPSSETLVSSYSRARLVSSGLEVYSSTVTGTTFAISGNINSVVYGVLPPMYNLTFDSLLTYSLKPWMSIAQAPIYEGVVAMNPPLTGSPFSFLGNDLYAQTITPYFGTWTYSSINGPWVGNAPLVWSWSHSTDIAYPSNWNGRYVMRVELISIGALPNTSVRLQVVAPVISTLGVVTQNYSDTSYIITLAAASVGSVTFSGSVPAEVEGLVMSINGGANLFTKVAIYLSLPDYGMTYQWGPGSIVAWEGVTAGQQLTLTSVNNWEAVPNAQLARQVGASMTYTVGQQDLESALCVIEHMNELGMSLVMNREAYREEGFRNDCYALSQRSVSYGYAAGFIPALANFLLPIFSPALKDLLAKGGEWVKGRVSDLVAKAQNRVTPRGRASYIGTPALTSTAFNRQ